MSSTTRDELTSIRENIDDINIYRAIDSVALLIRRRLFQDLLPTVSNQKTPCTFNEDGITFSGELVIPIDTMINEILRSTTTTPLTLVPLDQENTTISRDQARKLVHFMVSAAHEIPNFFRGLTGVRNETGVVELLLIKRDNSISLADFWTK